LYELACSYWNNKKHEKAVVLCQKLKLCNRLQSDFCALEFLVKSNKTELVKKLTKKNPDLAKTAVKLMTSEKHAKFAAQILKESQLSPQNYPSLLTILKRKTVRYHLKASDIGFFRLAEIVNDDLECLAFVIDQLQFECKLYLDKKKKNYAGGVAADIFRNYPYSAPFLRRPVKKAVENIPPRNFSLSDSFGPRNPEVEAILPFDFSDLKFVGSLDSVKELDLRGDVVGLDCEWRPSLTAFDTTKVSIIQIAFENRIYIVDLLNLNDCQLLDEKLSQMFSDPGIVKLGLSFSGDQKKAQESYPHMKCFKNPINNYCDLVDLFQKLNNQKNPGLAGLCEMILGLPLSKVEQMSNWENRPLRQSQLHYAAMDAYVQIPIYQVLLIQEPGEAPQMAPKSCLNCKSKMHEEESCYRGPKCRLCEEYGHESPHCPY